MAKRIHEVLFVASPYDLYTMEEEGLLVDRISDEYALFHLTNAPVITQVSTAEEALQALDQAHFDLVITGLRVGKGTNVFEMARQIKSKHPTMPVVLLTSETGRLASLTKRREPGGIDKIFLWHGDTRLFLAIIKSLEDRLNAPHDCLEEQVRVIILVEDSPHFYSTYLPLIYTEILEQTRSLIAEGTSDEEKFLRMTSRPKILMAETFEEAVDLYNQYRTNVLGVVADIRFPFAGRLDPNAGFAFTEMIKSDNPDVPVLLQSRDVEKAERVRKLGAEFADKNSPHLLLNLRSFILEHFGFGDFVFRTKDGQEVGRARNLLEMEKVLADVPNESIEYHGGRNHFSNWLFARGEFDLAAKLRPLSLADFSSIDEVRQTLIRGLAATRRVKRMAYIARFSEREFDISTPFVRIGEGSIGGKGRGIAFMSKMLSDPAVAKRFDGQQIFVPHTAAIGTDIFDHFLDRNRLHKVAMEETDNEVIGKKFVEAELGPKVVGELAAFLKRVDGPLAIRSSSLYEDSISQPFAGLYATYMIPNNHPDFDKRLRQFARAIKMVYASTFFSNPKAYMESNNIAVESEKMAVIVQRVVGRKHGDYFCPDLAGVAQSYNFFPVGYLRPEDGVAQLVMGLGTLAVRGAQALRFSPKHPTILPQFGRPEDWLTHTQREFRAVDLTSRVDIMPTDETFTLATLDLASAEEYGFLAKLGGVYSPDDEVIYEGMHREGQRVLTFKRALDGTFFPIPKIIAEMLELGSTSMGCPVEIEFACNLAEGNEPATFAFLQIRPLVTGEEAEEVSVAGIGRDSCVATTHRALGNGVFDGITNIVYVKPKPFELSKTSEIAQEIGRINQEMVAKGETYILLGFGRWGTINPQLGIPVAYSQVSHAKVIGEISTPELDVEPSQGTHFFHNIASCRIGYLSIDVTGEEDFIDWKWLEKQPAAMELTHVKLIKTSDPIVTRIDGRTGRGAILKP